MSVHNHFSGNGDEFAVGGPLVEVQIGVPAPLAAALIEAGREVPRPVLGLALIDTGASVSAVEMQVMQQLGVQPVNIKAVATPTGLQPCRFFPGSFSFPGTSLQDSELGSLMGADLMNQRIPGRSQPLIALIGRDVLREFVLVYNGSGGCFTLAR